MRNIVLAASTALVFAFLGLGNVAEAGQKCKVNPCDPIPAPGVVYKGSKVVKTISVTICHRQWKKLNGGPGQKWWGLTYRYASGVQENIKEIRSQCTTRDVVAGTQAGNMHDCAQPGVWKWYWTTPMTRPGMTYWVG